MKNSSTRIPGSSKPNGVQKVPKLILAIGKSLQFISPLLAMRFAIRLFGIPIRHPRPEREKMMVKSAQSEFLIIPELNKKIQIFTYGYSKKKALLVHGWSGRGTQMYAIADKLLENGYMTVSFDAPAHGNSTGKTTMMPEFMTCCQELDRKFGPFHVVIGHSLGGMALLNSNRTGLRTSKIVSIGAGDKISDIIKDFVKVIGLKQAIALKMIKHLNKKFGADIDTYASSAEANDLELPVLIIHDSQDRQIPVSCAYAIRQNLKTGQLLITQGLGHNRILNDPETIRRIVSFALE